MGIFNTAVIMHFWAATVYRDKVYTLPSSNPAIELNWVCCYRYCCWSLSYCWKKVVPCGLWRIFLFTWFIMSYPLSRERRASKREWARERRAWKQNWWICPLHAIYIWGQLQVKKFGLNDMHPSRLYILSFFLRQLVLRIKCVLEILLYGYPTAKHISNHFTSLLQSNSELESGFRVYEF